MGQGAGLIGPLGRGGWPHWARGPRPVGPGAWVWLTYLALRSAAKFKAVMLGPPVATVDSLTVSDVPPISSDYMNAKVNATANNK